MKTDQENGSPKPKRKPEHLSSGNTFLQHHTVDMSSLTFSATILDKMRKLHNDTSKLKHGSKGPDIWVTTQAIYEEYEALAEALRTIETKSTDTVSLGLGTMSFKGKPIIWDDEVPEGLMYCLNLDSLEFNYDPDVWFEMSEFKQAQHNLDRVAQIITRANLNLLVPKKNGVIYNISL